MSNSNTIDMKQDNINAESLVIMQTNLWYPIEVNNKSAYFEK